MRKKLFFTGQCVPKARPRVPRFGKAYFPKNYQLFQECATASFKEQWNEPPLESTRNVLIIIRGAARGDVDNLAGAVLDALVKAGVIKDDRVSVVPSLYVEFCKCKHAEILVEIEYE